MMTFAKTTGNHFETVYEIFRNGKSKYQMIWTNDSKKFMIEGKIVTEAEWDAAIKKDKA